MPAKSNVSPVIAGFAPIIPIEPKLLLLGTMPSAASLQQAFYYAHPRNAFWPIMAKLLNMNDQAWLLESAHQTPLTHYHQSQAHKVAALQNAGILLWDVLATCQRQGSLDSAIQQPVANDFNALFKQFPQLKTVAFNGQKAQQLFQKQVIKSQNLPNDLVFIPLPSTSPANATLTFSDKQLLWQEKLAFLR